MAFKTAIACELGIMCVVVALGTALSTAWTRIFTHDPVVSPGCVPWYWSGVAHLSTCCAVAGCLGWLGLQEQDARPD